MGCCASSPAARPLQVHETGPFLFQGELHIAAKASRLLAPKAPGRAPLPAVVLVHGSVAAGWLGGVLVANLGFGKRGCLDWTYTQALAEEVAALGFAVLMVGLPDDDDKLMDRYKRWGAAPNVTEEDIKMAKVANSWPARSYSSVIHAAIVRTAL